VQSFEPPARRNPHAQAAGARTRAWARRTGLTRARAAERTALCAWTHPDASAAELELIGGWHVLLDHALATRVDPARLHAPRVPAGPVERGLADLWPRTAARTSESWRERFTERTAAVLGAGPCSTDDLAEHLATLRRTGRASWSADLVEVAVGFEAPAGIAVARSARDAFCDAVHLRHDLLRHDLLGNHLLGNHREPRGSGTGAVALVVDRLGLDPGDAARRVADLLVSRLRRFEHLALVELPAALAEHDLPEAERDGVLRWVGALRDWLAGDRDQHPLPDRTPHTAPSLPRQRASRRTSPSTPTPHRTR
jgi:germacradienol/geosmin synthase